MKIFYKIWAILVFLTLLIVAADITRMRYGAFTGNLCPQIEKYNDSHIVPRTAIVRVTKKVFCLGIPPICTYHIYKIVHKNETITVEKTRLVFGCCSGFEEKDKSCVPVCEAGCSHGECIEPNVCECEAGWRGDSCAQPCEVNRYGRNCMENCTCQHEAACDSKTGSCHCQPGYKGTYCELPCPEDTYGQDCAFNCTCKNFALCDIKDGSCDCQPGYYGDDCEFPCEKGYHGHECEQECICIWSSTEKCSHIDGTCFCKPGYTGWYCEEECSNLTYGRDCENYCQCENAEFCDTVTGDCFCNAGWMGETCSQKCPDGYFGDGCLEKCLPCKNENEMCHHETGVCSCPPGSYGNFCENACPENKWGPECSEECECYGNSTCDRITGECICDPGWTGEYCNQTCALGKFGQNCTFDCLCKNCNTVTGSCIKSEAGQLKNIGERMQSLIIGFCSVLLIFIVLACIYCGKRFGPTIRNRWNSRTARNNNASTDNIIAVAYPNPLYSSSDGTGNPGTERSVSFIDLTSTIFGRLSSFSRAETSRASSCEAVAEQARSSLKRASKSLNLSAEEPHEKVDRNSGISKQAFDVMTDEDFIPESVSDFNTPENIIADVSEDSAVKFEVKKND